MKMKSKKKGGRESPARKPKSFLTILGGLYAHQFFPSRVVQGRGQGQEETMPGEGRRERTRTRRELDRQTDRINGSVYHWG